MTAPTNARTAKSHNKNKGPFAGKPKPPSVPEQHAEWLALLAATGPFLTLPVLTEVFPTGLETVAQPMRERIRQAWGEFDADPATLATAWQDLVLGELLRYSPAILHDTGKTSLTFGALRPDQVAFGPDPDGSRAIRLHLYRRPPGTRLSGLAEDAARVCRDSAVPLALLTDGRFWVLVHAVRGGPTSVAEFDADLWQEEPILLRAFATLLGSTRVLRAPKRVDGTVTDSLAALFARTADAQSEITTTLGGQVRQAVELFVAELARLDRESGGAVLGGVSDRDLYRGSLTTLMRLVFLLYAEQRELLPIKDPVYADGYAVTTLYRQLAEARDLFGDELGDRRSAAWPRLLATFAAVHGGCEHPDLRIPAHGGSLFDPKAHPWLARAAVTDRVVHEILDALLLLRHRTKAAERLSYTGLDVEQIGHVYEGLLEFSCLRVTEPYLGLGGKLEPELSLAQCEEQATQADDKWRAWLKSECDLTVKQVDKALAARPTPAQSAALHAACDNDSALADRVRPFWGLLRADLRKQPTVYPAGSVLFTQVGDRRSTGTHYTPRLLAMEVVEHTLAPLVYLREAPGVFRLRTAAELLSLKVCDPTMGSGAFLVAACRYLADRLVQAWERDGTPDDVVGTVEDVKLAALRKIAARCIYGVDRDDMAVDLAKLSMWLVTLARNKPFGFLDHALRCGDSLIGVLTERQVEMFHLNPDEGGRDSAIRTAGHIGDFLGPALAEATELRQRIEASTADDLTQINDKTALLDRADQATARLRLIADGVVAAALSTAGQGEDRYRDRLSGIAEEAGFYARPNPDPGVEEHLKENIGKWLTGHRSQAVRPFHWPLEFPEVMRDNGFDAVVGNPPFIGGQRLTGSIGQDVREYLVDRLANGKRGSADLCSYFLLRDLEIARHGRVGIIATNTIAQGDTREIGLDQAVGIGWRIYRAVKSQPWPGTASLEVSLLWVGHPHDDEPFHLDGRQVQGITPSLDQQSRVSGNPHRLARNSGKSFQGSIVLGSGFVLEPAQARDLIDRDPRNREVLFPYLNGEDLNSQHDGSPTRWVINFHDWTEPRAAEYPDCFAIVERDVKPIRAQNSRKVRRERWWQFAERATGLYKAIAGLERVLVIALVSKTGLPVWVPTGQVFSHALGVFATERDGYLSLLSSSVHFTWWTTKGESTLRTDARYTPSDGFETFPQPELTEWMDRVGEELHTFRRGVMLGQELGLTKLYNLVHDETQSGEDVRRLREIHTEVDNSVAAAYGWTDLDLGHGFHDTRQGRRFTIEPGVRTEILDRLLELNFERYDQEVRDGLHTKGRRKVVSAADGELLLDGGLFKPDGALF
ncbi:Eco57I restriction-modification methylase domain-containing protein [Actinokineospora sp.]|uniref:Eco57I restriction-modification methylase domain-containing protein n=1 Tax=Actinokineospora sp. TaxID=1872133 RepID=UPI0040376A91